MRSIALAVLVLAPPALAQDPPPPNPAPQRLAWGQPLAGRVARGFARATVPLALGMAALDIAQGASAKDAAIKAGSYLAAGLAINCIADAFIYPALFAAGPPGWIAAGLYTVAKIAATFYLGEKLAGWLRGLFARGQRPDATADAGMATGPPDAVPGYRGIRPKIDGVAGDPGLSDPAPRPRSPRPLDAAQGGPGSPGTDDEDLPPDFEDPDDGFDPSQGVPREIFPPDVSPFDPGQGGRSPAQGGRGPSQAGPGPSKPIDWEGMKQGKERVAVVNRDADPRTLRKLARRLGELRRAGFTHLYVDVPRELESIIDDYIRDGDEKKLMQGLGKLAIRAALAELFKAARREGMKIITGGRGRRGPQNDDADPISRVLEEDPDARVIAVAGGRDAKEIAARQGRNAKLYGAAYDDAVAGAQSGAPALEAPGTGRTRAIQQMPAFGGPGVMETMNRRVAQRRHPPAQSAGQAGEPDPGAPSASGGSSGTPEKAPEHPTPPAPAGAALRWKLRAGDVLIYEHTVEQALRIDRGDASRVQARTLEAVERLDVLDVRGDEGFVVQSSLVRLRAFADGKKVYDSEAPDRSDPNAAAALEKSIGMVQTFVMSPTGRVDGRRGATFLGDDASLGDLVRAPMALPLPEGATEPRSWSVDVPEGESVLHTRRYSFDGRSAVHGDVLFRLQNPPPALKLQSRVGHQRAEFDAVNGALRESEVDFTVALENVVQGETVKVVNGFKGSTKLKERGRKK